MVKAPDPDRPRIAAQTVESFVQRYNVAASRAKDQMWLFHSVTMDDLSGNREDMRSALLQYCYGVVARTSDPNDVDALKAVPEDVPVEPFDSLFEQRVFNRIVERGFNVFPQYDALGYRIDLVVQGANGRLAVECDGDFWHGPDVYDQDMARQRDLERCGWKFFRIRESAFYVDREAILQRLWDRLDELEIRPRGWVTPEPAEEEASEPAPVEDWAVTDRAEPAGSEPSVEPSAPIPTASSAQTTDAQGGSRLQPCSAFVGYLPSALEATRNELIDGLVEIVSIEGPVTGYRLQRQYVTSAGGQKVGPAVAKVLNRAITSAVRLGYLEVDDPLGQQGVKPKTYRVPSQPRVILRTLGDRDFDQIPPGELAACMDWIVERDGEQQFEAVARAVLAEYGLRRLTSGVEERFRAVLPLTKLVGGGDPAAETGAFG
jgi:very-short-patch-repair endonuclease